MIRIAIVEDDPADLAQEREFLKRFEEESGQSFQVRPFTDPAAFLDDYSPDYDMIFLDIELPHLSGIEAARRLREFDSAVTLIFLTNMEQCAVHGYEVDALDFVVKPINYYRFSSMMKKALRRIDKSREKEILVRSSTRITRLPISQLYYVEIRDHLLIFHSQQGDLDAWGKLSDVERELEGHDFIRCNNSNLVNLRYVSAMEGDTVVVAGSRLPVSQRRRKSFCDCVIHYLSGK